MQRGAAGCFNELLGGADSAKWADNGQTSAWPRFGDSTSWANSRRVGAPISGAMVLVERGSGRIVGAHLLGHHAEEVVSVFAVAMKAGLTAADLKAVPWAYSTGDGTSSTSCERRPIRARTVDP
jgi:hypothetical protein